MEIFDRYLFRNVALATVFVAATLAAVILLTQSLRFLELVLESGASGRSFWMLTLLALPRFFEIILPIALMAAIVFVYNKMTMDSELVVMRALGRAPMRLARPAIMLSVAVAGFLLVMTTWVAPLSLTSMQQMRQVIKAQYSTLLFRPGVFTNVVPGLTVYVRERSAAGELRGLMIHDSRAETDVPVTILAKRGAIQLTADGQQVLVYDGSRQDMNPENGILNRLDFERYTIDLPDSSGPVRQRWREPEERTLWELFNPDMANQRDVESRREFGVEIHRRLVAPLMAPALAVMALAFLLVGPVDRRGQGWRIMLATGGAVLVQGLYLGAFSLAQDGIAGLFLMYALVLGPLVAGGFMLSGRSENLRGKFAARMRGAAA
jgi:lipopolysaccharide export system permease protein